MTRAPWPYGKAVVDGKVRYLSPSAMAIADPASEGCPRKWHYAYIQGIRSPQTKAQTRGVDLHEELERYLKTGDRSLSSLALSGLHMVPDPGPDLGIELDIAGGALETAPVRAHDIPIVGYIDLVHARGTNKGANVIEETIDPPMTIEVMDFKSTSDAKWIKSAKEVVRSIQMTTYGKWVIEVAPKVEHIRLSHGYFVERGGLSRKVSLRVLPEQVERNWEHCAGVVRTISDVARETTPDRVPANTQVCDRFGGCPARDVCTARMHQALASFVGQTAADKLLGKTETQGEGFVGLLDKVRTSAAPVVGLVVPAPVVTTTPTETSVSLSFDMLSATQAGPSVAELEAAKAAERAKLEAEETAKRAAVQLRQAADKFAPILTKLEAYAAANKEMDLGMPGFSGAGAALHATCKGQKLVDVVLGSGKLAGQTVTNQADGEKIVAGLDDYAAKGAIKPAVSATPALTGFPGGLLSAETPAVQPSIPASTQAPVQVTTGTSIQAPVPQDASMLAPVIYTVQESAGNLADTVGTSLTTPTPAAAPTEKPGKKPRATRVPSGTSFNLIVDASIEGIETQSFAPILDAIAAEVATLSSDRDLRCAGVRQNSDGKLVFAKDESPCAFGRWEGILTALLQERAQPAGYYHLSTRGNRIAEVAAAALMAQCLKTGGIFVWGHR